MVYRKRKKENLFRNTGYENKLSKSVKFIERWVTDAWRGEKNDKMFTRLQQDYSKITICIKYRNLIMKPNQTNESYF